VGFWDHWVPKANDTLTALCNEWAAKEKVDIKIDYITSQGSKNLMTIAAEAQAKTGHDILAFPTWQPADKAHMLEPVDDLMKVLLAANGAVAPLIEYLARPEGRWIAVPTAFGSQLKGPCARIDLLKQHAGLDLTKMYPPGAPADKLLSDTWNWENIPPGSREVPEGRLSLRDRPGADRRFRRHAGRAVERLRGGARRREGQHHCQLGRCEACARVHEKARGVPASRRLRLGQRFEQQALIAGKSALIMNPPSAWAVAKRDNPKLAEQLWTFPRRAARRVATIRTCPTSGESGNFPRTRLPLKVFCCTFPDARQ